MAIPSKPTKLVKFRWKLSQVPTGAAQPPKPYVLRAAGEQELADALRVILSSYELDPEWSGCAAHIEECVVAGVKRAFGDEATCLFIQHGNRVIGVSAYLPEPGNDGVHLISGPCVLAEYRNRGLGAVLLAATLEALGSRGLAEAIGQVRPNTVSAKFLCSKFGGQPVAIPQIPLPIEAAVAA